MATEPAHSSSASPLDPALHSETGANPIDRVMVDAPAMVLDAFGYYPSQISRISGLGGQDPGYDPNYVFHTPYMLLDPGPYRMVLEFTGLIAAAGSLVVRIAEQSPAQVPETGVVTTIDVPLADLAAKGGRVRVDVEVRDGWLYAVLGNAYGLCEAEAEALSVLAVPSDGRPLSTQPAASSLATASFTSVPNLRSAQRATLDDPASQPATTAQLASPIFARLISTLRAPLATLPSDHATGSSNVGVSALPTHPPLGELEASKDLRAQLATKLARLNAGTPTTIACEGDSLTYGQDTSPSGVFESAINGYSAYGTRSSHPWPEELATMLGLAELQATVVNRGYPGDMSADGVERWAECDSVDIVFLCYGTNDASGSEPATTVDDYAANLERLIYRRRHQGSAVVVLGPPDSDSREAKVKLRPYKRAARAIAERHGCLYVDVAAMLNGVTDYWTDGIHLAATAYAEWGRQLAALLIGGGHALPRLGLGDRLAPDDQRLRGGSASETGRLLKPGETALLAAEFTDTVFVRVAFDDRQGAVTIDCPANDTATRLVSRSFGVGDTRGGQPATVGTEIRRGYRLIRLRNDGTAPLHIAGLSLTAHGGATQIADPLVGWGMVYGLRVVERYGAQGSTIAALVIGAGDGDQEDAELVTALEGAGHTVVCTRPRDAARVVEDRAPFDYLWSSALCDTAPDTASAMTAIRVALDWLCPGGLAVFIARLDLMPPGRPRRADGRLLWRLADIERMSIDLVSRGHQPAQIVANTSDAVVETALTDRGELVDTTAYAFLVRRGIGRIIG